MKAMKKIKQSKNVSFCGYCGKEKPIGWHDCPKAIAGKARLESVIGDIDDMMAHPPTPIVSKS